MGGLTDGTSGSLVETETENVESSKEVHFGELLWVKLHEDSWWPAQIVDENLVSSANKPSSKGSSGDVLVRLYGCYIYKYIDIHKSSVEFKSILIKNNFNYHDLLKKSLEQDLPSLNSSKSRKKKLSKSKGRVVTVASQNGSSDKSQVSSRKRKQEKPTAAESHSQTPEVVTKNPKPTLNLVQHGTEPSTPNSILPRIMPTIDKSWIKLRNRNSLDFINGLKNFIEIAKNHVNSEGKAFCPCRRCAISIRQDLQTIERHVRSGGFLQAYDIWHCQGEKFPNHDEIVNRLFPRTHPTTTHDMFDVIDDVIAEQDINEENNKILDEAKRLQNHPDDENVDKYQVFENASGSRRGCMQGIGRVVKKTTPVMSSQNFSGPSQQQ